MLQQIISKLNEKQFDDEVEKVLKNEEETQKQFWNLDRQCANFLNTLIQIKQAKNVLEIGTSNGYSGIWIAEALKKHNGMFTTIEFWEKRQSVARGHFQTLFPDFKADFRIGQALVVLDDLVEEVQKGYKPFYDFVFIDANKLEYVEYFKKVDLILASKGVILADNILSHYEKVYPYVKALFERRDYQSQILDMGAGMMLSIKQ